MIECTACHMHRPESDFYIKRDKTRGTERRERRCKMCFRAAAKATYANESREIRESRREARRGYTRAYRARHIDKVRAAAREHHLRKHYGLTLAEQDMYMSVQGGKCAICRKRVTPGTRGFCVDHCHSTGTVRGILCNACNLALGYFKDDPVRLQRAVAYLLAGAPEKRFDDVARLHPKYLDTLRSITEPVSPR